MKMRSCYVIGGLAGLKEGKGVNVHKKADNV
jgi:hypothetical protein